MVVADGANRSAATRYLKGTQMGGRAGDMDNLKIKEKVESLGGKARGRALMKEGIGLSSGDLGSAS